LDGSCDCDAWGAYFAAANGYKLSACRIFGPERSDFLGAELIFIKRLTGGEPPLQILLINNLLGALISTLAVAFVLCAPSLLQWMALVSIGGLMAAAQLCFVNAMARGDASFVSPFLYATLIFATLYDSIIFGVVPGSVSVLGAGIILAGAVLLAWREAVRKAPMT
jgi:drug/metabolite transporter (DMT)-like permease